MLWNRAPRRKDDSEEEDSSSLLAPQPFDGTCISAGMVQIAESTQAL